MKTIKARYALLIAVGLLMTGLLNNAMADTQNWKGAINGVWATAANDPTATNWQGNVTWTNGNDAVFPVGGTSIATINGAVTARSVSSTGGANLIVTNGVLNLGVGGLNNLANNDTFRIYSDITLTATQAWTANRKIYVYGPMSGTADITISGLNAYPATLVGSNTFSGSVTLQNGANLDLDFGTQNNQKLDPSSGLTVSNTAQVQWLGGATAFTQAVNGITITGAGDFYLNRVNSNNVLSVGAITRTGVGSTLRFGQVGAVLTTQSNTTGILGGWATTPAAWAVNTGGAIAQSYGNNQNNSTLWNTSDNVSMVATVTMAGNMTINTLRFGGSTSLDLGGNTLTLAGGGLMAANNNPTVSNGFIQSGLPSGELFVYALNGVNQTNNAVIQDNGATPTVLVKAGGNTLALGGPNTYSGPTYINQGPLHVNTNGALGTNTINVGYNGTLSFNRTDTYSLANRFISYGIIQNINTGTVNLSLSGTNTFGLVQNSGIGTLTVNALSGSSNSFVSIKNNSTGILILDGSANSVNTATFAGSSGGFLVFSNGVWKSGGQRNLAGNITVGGGTFHITNDRLSMGADGQQLSITGGLLSLTNTTYGLRLGTDNPTGVANGPSFNFSGSQSGGSVVNASGRIDLGGVTAGKTISYDFSDGSMSLLGVNTLGIGAATNAGSTTTFTLRNAGRLSIAGTIQGGAANDLTALQIFTFSGGTLAANAINATYLRASASVAPGTFVNAGGILAPGDIGTAGKTTVTGSYSNAPSAVLAIDIGGTTLGSAFQNVGAYYDTLSVSANAVLDGRLAVSLINGYVPASTATKFTVLTSAGLSGAFTNVVAGKVWCTDGYSRFDVLTNATANAVVLSNYMVNTWSPTSGNTWDTAANWALATEPNGSAFSAYFGTGGAGTVTLDTAHTVRGLIFTNSAASYTIAGAALTLQGDALTALKISVLAGSHTISAAMALSNATEIAVATNSVLTLTGGITGGQAVTKTGTGTLALSNVNMLGVLTISAGTVRFAAGTTTVSALTLATGAMCDFVTGTLYILKNGGGLDTLDEVNAAITANSITLRGKNALPIDFKVTEEGAYIKVTARLKGTVISFQ